MLRRVYGKKKQGVGFGHAKIGGHNVWLRGYNPLIATLSTPLCAPVIAATRLRAGNAASARGAAWRVAEAIRTARVAGASGLVVVRADSAFYAKTVIWACRRNRGHFSITARMDALCPCRVVVVSVVVVCRGDGVTGGVVGPAAHAFTVDVERVRRRAAALYDGPDEVSVVVADGHVTTGGVGRVGCRNGGGAS
jgi:hypothetical protein